MPPPRIVAGFQRSLVKRAGQLDVAKVAAQAESDVVMDVLVRVTPPMRCAKGFTLEVERLSLN